MYTKLNDVTVGVSTFSGAGSSATTLVFHGQQDLSAVLSGIGQEIRLYEDEAMTQLAAIYNQVEVSRATVDMTSGSVSVTITATRLTDLETEQLKMDVAQQRVLQNEGDDALIELAGMMEEQMDAIAELGQVFDAFRQDVESRLNALEHPVIPEEEPIDETNEEA